MRLPPDSVIEERLVKTFPNTRLIQREGEKLKAEALFWSLAIGFLSGNYRTLEEFRQEYIDTFGGSLEYSSFHEWFMLALCDFLREVLKRGVICVRDEYRSQIVSTNTLPSLDFSPVE